MNLYELDAVIESLLEQEDPETGELLCDMDQLDAVIMERDAKLENIALYIKNKTAEAKAIMAEKQALEKRQKAASDKAERARAFLAEYLQGEKFTTPKVAVSWRRSSSVEIGEGFWTWAVDHPEFVRRKDPEPEKKMIGDAIKKGLNIPGAEIVEKLNMQVK